VKPRIFSLMLFCLIGGSLERSLMVARGGEPTIINGVVSLGSRVEYQTVASCSCVIVSPADSLGSRRTSTEFPEDYAMPRINDLLGCHRIRTRNRFDNNFQNDFTVARNGHIPLNSYGIIVATRDDAQPVMFLSAATARGPPWSGDQNLYLLNNALDRPAPHFCTVPPLFRVPISRFLVSPQRDSPVHPIIHCGSGWCFVCCSHFPIKHNPTVHLKELL
jgi:hypothetical protein